MELAAIPKSDLNFSICEIYLCCICMLDEYVGNNSLYCSLGHSATSDLEPLLLDPDHVEQQLSAN